MRSRSLLYLLLILFSVTSFTCHKGLNKLTVQKIQFDYANIDYQGLRNGEVAVDYEFCIPAHEAELAKVIQIDPAVRVLKTSRGRIGCTKQQWLCINTTYATDWKNKLQGIAQLQFVDRIVETHYE